MLKMDITSFA